MMTTPVLSLIFLACLVIIHMTVVYYAAKRIAAGKNGITPGLLWSSMAMVVYMINEAATVAAQITGVMPDIGMALSISSMVVRLLLLLASVNLVIVVRLESGRPLKRQSQTMRQVWRMMKGDGE